LLLSRWLIAPAGGVVGVLTMLKVEPPGLGDGRPPPAIATADIDEPATLQRPSRGTQSDILGPAQISAIAYPTQDLQLTLVERIPPTHPSSSLVSSRVGSPELRAEFLDPALRLRDRLVLPLQLRLRSLELFDQSRRSHTPLSVVRGPDAMSLDDTSASAAGGTVNDPPGVVVVVAVLRHANHVIASQHEIPVIEIPFPHLRLDRCENPADLLDLLVTQGRRWAAVPAVQGA
jgi:hypothetical protein